MTVSLADVEAARAKIRGVIRQTPLRRSETLSRMAGFPIYVKMENQQKTGSFKLRGAVNRILGRVGDRGVIAASAGNHAQGVAYAAQRAGVPAVIVMPKGASITKADATRNYGARVIQEGDNYDECFQIAWRMAEAEGYEYIHAFDDPLIIAGQGTIALEVLETQPEIRQLVVPIGGGGLISGIAVAAKALNPSVRVVGVQARGADAVFQTFRQGTLVEADIVTALADGIAIKKPGQLTSELIWEYVDDVLTVSDEEIASAMLAALERLKTLVEGAGAAALAAALYRKGLLSPLPTAVVLSGGNVDANIIAHIIQRGLVQTGRLATLEVSIPDKPGNLHRVLDVISRQGANVISVVHERLGQEVPLGWTSVTLTLETRNREHIERLQNALHEQGLKVKIS
ncbi:MAG: threonine ammonia-lyase [Firmicutes bacterium]|nr:threonine ammonia-lyase [Bacillota bacterium]HOB35373.1 threonine ammonia-lyase [Bacillota bacterium]HPZ91324.1 threonine ammonia-lyase [Bacillota bacterium]HQE02438.1 threonine ammonia-lyase [Bacillota bacterium]